MNNTNQVQGAANLSDDINMTEEELFIRQMALVFDVQRDKRRGRDSLAYENDIIALTVRGVYGRLDKTLRIENNYAFLVSLPSWREIMAAEFEGRKIDHEICDKIIPLADKVLSPFTFNNRIGKGSQGAINQLIEHIAEVSCGYTKPVRIIKIDFKGFFPNALWDFAEKIINEVIDLLDEPDSHKDYLRWLTMVAVHCNPAAHCELRSPKYVWSEHIDPEKSILSKPEGIGAAIGRLIWQTAMGLYINDLIIWLTKECGIRLVCFVDDIVMVVPEGRHYYALSLIPEIREKLKGRNVRLNERKFYDQPYQHGVEFLGSHIRTYRVHLNNRTYYRATHRIKELNKAPMKNLDKMVQSFNSYGGLLKSRTDYKRLMALKDLLSPEWWKYLNWDNKRFCLTYKKGYSINERLNLKYNLKIDRYDKTRTASAA